MIRTAFLLVLTSLMALAASAQTASRSDCSARASVSFDRFDTYMDGTVDALMKEGHVVGLAVAIVHCGEIRVLKGFGYADVKELQPVDPDYHLFRIASLTKTMTFTALMQQVEASRISLDDPIDGFLDGLSIPEHEAGPIRVRDLMSHRAGFEDGAAGYLFERDPADQIPLQDFLERYLPERVRAPGAVTSYSNYSAALAGRIVENISGENYADYVEANIFMPLGMESTTAREPDSLINDPMSQDLANRLAQIYRVRSGRPVRQGFEYIGQNAPIGVVSSTAADMARYMIAHLNEGQYGSQRILAPDSVLTMRERPYRDRAGTPDFAHGFANRTVRGYAAFEHGGATLTSFTSLRLIPELELGIFVTTNGTRDPGVPHVLSDLFTDRLITQTGPDEFENAIDFPASDAEIFSGNYLTNRRSYSRAEKIFYPFIGSSRVNRTDDGYLTISGGPDEGAYRRIGVNLFHATDGSDDVIFFQIGRNGRAERFVTARGHHGFDRVTIGSSLNLLFLIFAGACLLAMTTLLGSWRRKSLLATPEPAPVWARRLDRLINMSAATVLLSGLAFIATLASLVALGTELVYDWPPNALVLLGMLGLILVLCTVALTGGLWFAVTQTSWTLSRKAHYFAFTVFSVALVGLLCAWNLVGFQF